MYNIYYIYVLFDRYGWVLVLYIEDGIFCKSMCMNVFCLKDKLFLFGMLSKYVLWIYYFKIIVI